jgi:hypothetical protein
MKMRIAGYGVVLAAGMVSGMWVAHAWAEGERSPEAGSRSVRFRGSVKAVDGRTGRFVVPVRRGRDGEPAGMVDVLVVTERGTRFLTPAGEGRAASPARFQDLAPGLTVNISGVVGRDGSVVAQEVTLFRKGGAEAEAGPRRSPEAEAGPRTPPEAGRRDGETPREGRRAGDGESPRTGPRDGEGRPNGPRDTGQPGTEAQAAGMLAGRVKALDARRSAFVMEWRVPERGAFRNVRGLVFLTPNTRLSTVSREGGAASPLTFRDLQVGSIVHVRGAESPDGLVAAEVQVFPAGRGGRAGTPREGGGRAPAEGEGRRSPEGKRGR